jgi:hypothetical protein
MTAKVTSACCQPNAYQQDGERREQKLPERTGRRSQTEGDRAPLRRQDLAERRQHDHQRRAGKPEADQHPGRQIEHWCAGRMRHQHQAEGVHEGAGAQHADRSEAVGDHAGERLPHAPQQILHRQGEGKYVTAPMIGGGERREEEAECRARTECDGCYQAAEADDDDRSPPRARLRCLGCRARARGLDGHGDSGVGIRNAAHHTASVSTAQTKLRQKGAARIAAPRQAGAITAVR